MTAYKNKLTPDYSDGVDRKLLKTIKNRFLQVNADRLDKCYQGLSARHQDVLRVLPLLYHINHPLMPGYVAQEAPLGVSAYEPDKATLSIAKSFSQTFKFKSSSRQNSQIHAIFMMGSTGTLAHSESSDVDLWLCFDPQLSAEAQKLLSEKALKIDQWANKLGLELHTFLMDADKFRAEQTTNRMDKESSGSAQHYLLLDEFYRTAILLAGRYPIWWLIPPEMEADYSGLVDMLLTKRFVKPSDVIDFGSAADIPKSELIGAGLWQLYKGLDSPYKSVLKILLAEVYAQELPETMPLSQAFKHAVYDDELSVEELDPYLAVYRRLEKYLIARREHKRLDVVQKSFYLKVAKKLSKSPSGRTASWQRSLLEKVVRTWGWPEDKFRYLDTRASWKLDQVQAERQVLVAELSYCYRFLSQYARAHGIRSSITAEDMNLLGRKLYANFQKKAGKIERINPGIVSSLWEENLALHHTSSQVIPAEQSAWLLYRDLNTDTDASFEVPLKKSASLIELLSWLYFNGILTSATRLSMNPGDSGQSLYEVQNTLRALEQSVPMPLPAVHQQKFLQQADTERLFLFVNIGVDPMQLLAEEGMHRLSDRTDVLDYSTERFNLVRTIDQVSINSWNEVSAYRFEVGETLMQTLQSYLQLCQAQIGRAPCELSVFCFCPQRAVAIAARVNDVFSSVKRAFFVGDDIRLVRYVLEVEERHYLLQYVDEQFRYFSYSSDADLYKALMQGPRKFSPIIFDEFAQQDETLVSSVLPYNQANKIQIFYLPRSENYQVIVLDENGSLLRLVLAYRDEELLLSVLSECLQRMLEARQLSELGSGDQLSPALSFNKLVKGKEGEFRVREHKNIRHCEVNEIQLSATFEGGDLASDLYFEGMEFSSAQYGEQQYEALLHYALKQGAVSARIPIAVSEVLINDSMSQFNIVVDHSKRTLETLRVFAKADRQLHQALQKITIK